MKQGFILTYCMYYRNKCPSVQEWYVTINYPEGSWHSCCFDSHLLVLTHWLTEKTWNHFIWFFYDWRDVSIGLSNQQKSQRFWWILHPERFGHRLTCGCFWKENTWPLKQQRLCLNWPRVCSDWKLDTLMVDCSDEGSWRCAQLELLFLLCCH